MSEAREWAERLRTTRPSLDIVVTDPSREPSLRARVMEDGSCEITISFGFGPPVHTLFIPHNLAVVLGKFLVRTFSEPVDLIHGRPHDSKMAEDHE